MTRHIEATGPSDLLQTPLAVRTVPGVSLTQNESNDQHIRNAINEGKNISGLLADNLKRSSLADNEESNLFQVLSLAGELRNYQSPVEFSIGLVGDSGVGKSSLINSLLDTENLAKTAGTGSACTTIVTEYRKKRESDTAAYTVEIERIGNPEMEDLLQQSVLDYRRYHLLDRDDPEGPDKTEIEQLRVKAELAWNTLIAAFVDRDGCTDVLFQNTGISTDEITQMVLGWKNQIIWPAGLDSSAAILTADSAPDCADQIEKLLKKLMWPFIKVVRIYLDAVVLQNGIILVDLPGFRDVNSARVRVTETRLYQCDEIFVVAEISRVVTNKGVEDLVVRQLGKNFNSLKRSQGVTIICTKSEDLGHESEILRDVPVTNEFNGQILGALQRQIEEAVENGEPERELRARRAHLFVSARNEHVKRHLVRHYASQRQVRTIDVYCVSNNLYREAADLQDGVQRSISNRRRSSNLGDRISAADQMLRSSGIPELRDFIQGIPVKSQISETRHFLNTRLLSLLEKTQMWLTASASEIAANQAASPELVQEIQTELKAKFDTSVETSHGDLTNAKMEILHRPFTQGMRSWQDAALANVSIWENKWSHATFRAFWSHDGAHTTPSQPRMDWNKEIIKAMVDDTQPLEELFRLESERIFETLNESTNQGLLALPARLSDLHQAESFIESIPRRRRHLDYEIENITTWFFDELQTIFHNLLKAHGTSYVMRHMLPMYNEIDGGSGVTGRRVRRLKLQISGDTANHHPLFKVIRDFFLTALSELLGNTKAMLQEAVDKCSTDIGDDLELVRGESVPASDENNMIGMMFDALEEAQTNRAKALRDFEAKIRR